MTTKPDFVFDPTLFCVVYERAMEWAMHSGSDYTRPYYWTKFRSEIYAIYWRLDKNRAIKAGQIYPFSKQEIKTKLQKYMRKDAKTHAPLRVLRVRHGVHGVFGHEVHDAVRKRIDYHTVTAGVPDELRDHLAVLLITEPGMDMPGIGYRAGPDLFYLER
jgi:hypothetical protein